MMARAHPTVALRPFLAQDAEILAAIFRASIEELSGDDYSEAQQAAWASAADDEEEFGTRFVRVHRNCLVARDAIRGFERRVSADGDAHWEVLLRGVPEALPVSRRQQFIVREIGRDSP